jgi:hypothetical protein
VGICGKSWKEQNKEEKKEEKAFLFALREIKERRKCKIEFISGRSANQNEPRRGLKIVG